MSAAVPIADESLRRSQVRRALVASTVGTSIEWYDFFLYGTAAALVFPKLFFPDSNHYAGVLASFAIYADNRAPIAGFAKHTEATSNSN